MSSGSKRIVFVQDRKYVELLFVLRLVTDKLLQLIR